MGKLLKIAVVVCVAMSATAVFAQGFDKIAAVVNDEVISIFDLNSRLSLVIAGSEGKDSPEARRRLAPQILRQLIDETLQLQEAKRLNIRITDTDLERALALIESQNNIKKGMLDSYLAAEGIDKLTLIGQVEPEIAWAKVIGRRIRPQVQVSPEAVDETLARIEAGAGKPEHLLSEIFLRVDDPKNETEVKRVASRISQQLKAGASFPALARNFSQSASGPMGGDLGWVRQGELEDELRTPVAKLQPRQLVGPIRTFGGFHILLLRQRRIAEGLKAPNVKLELQQLFFPIQEGAPSGRAIEEMGRARTLAAKAKNCADMEKLGSELGTGMSGSLGTVNQNDLPAPLRKAVETLDPGRPSEPVRTGNGVVVLMVCSREGAESGGSERNRIERMLTAQRVESAARRYLRDLRRAAFIDIRL